MAGSGRGGGGVGGWGDDDDLDPRQGTEKPRGVLENMNWEFFYFFKNL